MKNASNSNLIQGQKVVEQWHDDFYESTLAKSRGLCKRILYSSKDAEDFASQAFAELCEKPDAELSKHPNPQGLISRILKNLILNEKKRIELRRDELTAPDVLERYHIIEDELEGYNASSQHRFDSMMSKLSHELSPTLFEPLKMQVEGYQNHDICETLHLTSQTLKVRLHRAREKAKDVLGLHKRNSLHRTYC